MHDKKQIKKKQVTLTLYSFAPSDINFQLILMPKVILAKKNCHNKSTHLDHSYLKYALSTSKVGLKSRRRKKHLTLC